MGQYRTRRRPYKETPYTATSWAGPGYQAQTYFDKSVLTGTEVTRSFEGGAWPLQKAIREREAQLPNAPVVRPLVDLGNEFTSTKSEFKVSHMRALITGSDGRFYNGPLIPRYAVAQAYPTIPNYDSELIVQGTKAIRLTLPTQPEASLATFLGEIISDGLPTLILGNYFRDHTKSLLRNSGKEYLNVQFGWLPLINDLKKMAIAVKNFNKILTNYRNGAATVTRRRHNFPPTMTGSSLLTNAQQFDVVANPFPSNMSGTGYLDVNRLMNTKTWFSGAYTYYIPTGDSIFDKFMEYGTLADKLLGTALTPAVVWELTPWSWLADWFFNAGDIIANASALSSDNLVLHYGYIMRTTEVVDVYHLRDVKFNSVVPLKSFSAFKRVERKERKKANPYGFGPQPSQFTDRQWSILAALGLTKAPKTLW